MKALSKTCKGYGSSCSRDQKGKHILCNGRVARMAAMYQIKSCKAILSGFKAHAKHDGIIKDGIIGMFEHDSDKPKMADAQARLMEGDDAEADGYMMRFDDGEGPSFDDITKQELPW